MTAWIGALLLTLFMAAWSADARPVLIDINSATIGELETLPGIQDGWARAIVKNRPYANKEQLVTRKVISPAAYRRISALIIARR